MDRELSAEWKKIDEVRRRKTYLFGFPSDKENFNGTKDTYVYQYRTLESFWTIVSSDSFWATNARFSNDLEEQSIGYRKIMEYVKDKQIKEQDLIGDCYIICFCSENDKLSQWRGYAKDGVSIGFDFANIRPYYIQERDRDVCQIYYNACFQVHYIDEHTSSPEFIDTFDLSSEICANNDSYLIKYSDDIIPYVKHKGFFEETESRLVYSGSYMDMSKYIRYREEKKRKIPYIVVKMGDVEEKKNEHCVIRINAELTLANQIKEILDKELEGNVSVLVCADINGGEVDDRSCYGCTLREVYRLGMEENRKKCRFDCGGKLTCYIKERKEIYISDCKGQEEVFEKVDAVLQREESFSEIKIWCDGHLPIRNITVSSMSGKEDVAESIRHYCKNHYWLKYVDVGYSKIPYRSDSL